MSAAALVALRAAQAAAVDALQLEYFQDDLAPPPAAFGWSDDELVQFFESGGSSFPPPAATSAAAAPAAAANPDPALMQFLDENEPFKHLKEPLGAITWDEIEELYAAGRPKLLSRLGKLGVSLGDRQKFATVFGKATKPAGAAKQGQPGGGRPQPKESFVLEAVDVPGVPMDELVQDLSGYRAQIVRDGIPLRVAGLFPPDDPVLGHLARSLKAATKGLPGPTSDGGMAFRTAENGWACGESAIEHGMDLRWFVSEDAADQTLTAAVRFSDFACIGRGHATGVHGGAVETCLDEATAECAKTKLFPMASTGKIEFQIKKPVQPNVTYRVKCYVKSEKQKGMLYDVVGELLDADRDDDKYAVCTALMANAPAFAKEAESRATAGLS